MTAYVFVIMGVSGCGKTTVGRQLAHQLGAPFYDGDDFHSAENIAKMANGQPLNDTDRHPWLGQLHDLLAGHLARGETAVLACSALKQRYREQLQAGDRRVRFVHLSGSFDLIWSRMAARPAHYMKADMLQSQFEALEPPSLAEAFILDITHGVDQLVEMIKCATKST